MFQVTHKNSGRSYSFFLSSEYERSQWVETLQVLQTSLPANPSLQSHREQRGHAPQHHPPISLDELQAWITSSRRSLATNMGSFLMRSPRDEPLLVGDLHLAVNHLQGLTRASDLFVVAEVDSYGHFFRKAKTRTSRGEMDPVWEEEFIVELEGSENLRILVYEEQQQQGSQAVLRGRATLELSRTWLTGEMAEQRISMNDVVLTCAMKFVAFEETMRRVPQVAAPSGGGPRGLMGRSSDSQQVGLFGAPLAAVSRRESRPVPFIITSCVREVERRGLGEVGIYRVSGSSADVSRLRRAYETNPYEAEQLLKECDVHSVAGALKLYLRDLPECLFTAAVYQRLFEAYHERDQERRRHLYLQLFAQVPQSPNQACCVFLIEHIVRVAQCESRNKMSLHNLATVFGPTMLHPGVVEAAAGKKGAKFGGGGGGPPQDQLATGTVDVMAQAGILHFFISRRARGEPIQIVERQV